MVLILMTSQLSGLVQCRMHRMGLKLRVLNFQVITRTGLTVINYAKSYFSMTFRAVFSPEILGPLLCKLLIVLFI